MQTSGGKNNIQGTLSSLKLFEKILKSDEISGVGASNPKLLDQTPLSKYPLSGKDFRSETKQREATISQMKTNNSNQKINNQINKESKYYSSGVGSQHQSMIDGGRSAGYDNQEPQKKKVAFSNSISGMTQNGINVQQPRAPALVDTNKTFDGINEIIGAVNSYLSTGSANQE